jgi:peptidoglycan hydrolase-like protein with peptidoglycan-binding domain
MLAALVAAWLPSAQGWAAIPPLKLGDRGGEVATWQAIVNYRWRAAPESNRIAVKRFLRTHGFLVVDGVFGPLTEQATRIYQRQFHLRPSGIVRFASWKSFTFGNLSCCGAGYPLLSEGQWSPSVTWWQIGLDRWLARHVPGILQLIPDGVYGPRTRQATATFQASVGIPVDGIAGPITWGKMADAGFLHMP